MTNTLQKSNATRNVKKKKKKKQENMRTPKEHNYFSVTDHRVTDLFLKEDFKVIVLRKLSKLPEKPDRQLNKSGKYTGTK